MVRRVESRSKILPGAALQPFGRFGPLRGVAPSRLTELADLTLLGRFLDGDEDAFRVLYDRHTPRVRLTLKRVLGRDGHDLDDALQETWVAACRGARAFRGDAAFASWLVAIGVRVVFNRFIRARAETELSDDIASPFNGGPANAIDLERAIAALPNHQRAVVVLHDIEGFTHDEIAAQLNIAPGTSKATLSRARQALRVALTEGEINAKRRAVPERA